MKLSDLKKLDEAAYPGNLGMMEMFKFYQVADNKQKEHMKELIKKNLIDQAWELLQAVTGVKLK